MKTTRMRMTKEAASLIHDWRDEHEHETNAEAIHDLFADYWATDSKVMHLEGFKSRYDEMRFRYQANARALADSQKMLHKKDTEMTEVKSENGRLKRSNCLIKKFSDDRALAYKGQIKALDESLERKCALIYTLRADRKCGLDQISELEKQIERIESFRMMWKGAATAGWATLLIVCAGLLAHMIITP